MRTEIPTTATREEVCGLARELGGELGDVAVALADAIHEGIEGLDADLHRATAQSCLSNLRLIVSMLEDDLEPTTAQAPAEAVHYAREFVQRGLGVELLIQAYRLGHQTWWQIWLDRVRANVEGVEEMAAVITYSSDWFFNYVDTLSGEITDAYMEERERWVRSAAALRVDEVRAILAGGPVAIDDVSRRLRYELRRRHVAIVVWGREGEGAEGTMGAYEKLANDLGRTLGGDVLSAPLGRMVLAAWVGLRGDPDAEALAALRVDDAAAAIGARVAVGQPGDGIDGFRRSHGEAMLARRVSMLAGRRPGCCVRFGDVALNALLTADPDEARRFVEGELGPLADDEDSSLRLSATLRVFLEEGASFKRASRRLGVHENTVAYRVRRAAELLGHGVEERQLELRVALQLADLLRRADASAVA
jgi:hypothetical protein